MFVIKSYSVGVSIAYEIQQQTIVKWNIILKIQKFH